MNKFILALGIFILTLTACQEDPGKILANSDNPHEIKKALYRLGQDTTKVIPKGLNEGIVAPYFSGYNHHKKPVALSQLTAKGKVVLFFYRGYWCGICNSHLANFQDSLSFITDLGASVVAVAPQTAEYQERTIVKNNLSITVISDSSQTIMKQFDVAYDVNKGYQDKIGVDLEKVNGKTVLPVPATYIIDENGVIIKKFFNPDFRDRASVAEIVSILKESD